MKFATKPYDNTHLTLGMLLHYLGKLYIQIRWAKTRQPFSAVSGPKLTKFGVHVGEIPLPVD